MALLRRKPTEDVTADLADVEGDLIDLLDTVHYSDEADLEATNQPALRGEALTNKYRSE